MSLREIKHNINNDVQNILSLLKYINNEVKIEDRDIKQMLEAVISKEDKIINNIKQLNKFEG